MPDRVLGLVSVKDLWAKARQGEKPDLRSLLQEPVYLPEGMSALRGLERLRETGSHLALVLDDQIASARRLLGTILAGLSFALLAVAIVVAGVFLVFSPDVPLSLQRVTFTSTSTDPDGTITDVRSGLPSAPILPRQSAATSAGVLLHLTTSRT